MSPTNVAVVGLSSVTVAKPWGTLDRLAGWSLSTHDRGDTINHRTPQGTAQGTTGPALAEAVETLGSGRRVLWLYTWSTMRLIVLTSLPGHLAARGWVARATGMGSQEPSMTMVKGDRKLIIVPLRSWVGGNPWQLYQRAGGTAPHTTGAADSPEWLAHLAEHERATVADAILAIMAWWDGANLGHWRPTGASCGWGAARHTLDRANRILIDPDPDGIAHDRAAIYGGTRFTTRHGRMPQGHYAVFDLTHAYGTAMACCLLPVGRRRRFTGPPPPHIRPVGHMAGIIGDVVVRTKVPRYPVRYGDRIYYPVGQFATTLAGPDLEYAIEHGDLVSWSGGTIHRLGIPLQRFGRWMVDQLDADPHSMHPAVRATIKGWSRSVAGKFAAHGTETRVLSDAIPGEMWALPGVQSRNGVKCGTIALGGKVFYTETSGDGQNAYPAVLAFIESYVRCALFRAMESVGRGSVIQCDTDGMIVDIDTIVGEEYKGQTLRGISVIAERAMRAIASQLPEETAPFTMRLKGTTDVLWITGPQHYEGRAMRVAAGTPIDAHPGIGRTVRARITPTLRGQVEQGNRGGMVKRDQVASWPTITTPGWAVTHNRVLPPTAHQTPSGTTVIETWDETRWRAMGYTLHPEQSPSMNAIEREHSKVPRKPRPTPSNTVTECCHIGTIPAKFKALQSP